MSVRFSIDGEILVPVKDAKMTEAIYIKKPEDIINLSPDRENDITKDKNHINDKHKQRVDREGNAEYGDKAVNNNENKFGYSGNYYVKEPGSEESLNTPGGYHDNDSEPRDLDVADLPDTSNMNELTAYNYDDNTAGTDSIPLEPLALDESFEENSRRLVEVDDDGNTLKTHSRIPSKYAKSGVPTPQNPQTEHLLQALARLDLETIPTESHDVQPVATDEDYLTPRTHEHIYAEIVDRKVERHVKPTGSVRVVENERRVRVPIIRRLTRTFSINRRHGHGHRNSSSTLYRNTLSRLPKTPPEKENVTCSCNKKILMFAIVIVVLLLSVIAAVLLTLVLNKRDEPVKPKDVIFPTVTCPGSQVVTLNQRKKYVTLDGAETKDNTGIKLLEYKAIIKDDSATFEEPDVLVLTRDSLGNTYVISVKTLDLDDNQAFCNYTISVQEDVCVPWRLPEVEGASREEVPTQDGGWQVTLQCAGHKNGAAGVRAPHVLSYYYLDTPAVFTCSCSQGFLPEQPFSCQEADLARFKYITAIKYWFLDNNGDQLQNITMEKAKSCFDSYYTKRLLNIQQKKSMQLEQAIKTSDSSATFGDVSQIELAPIPHSYPKILEYDQENGKIQSIKVGIGYQVGPVNQPFPYNLLDVYVGGMIQQQHTTLFSPEMRPFGRLQGNVNAGCPDVLAPPDTKLPGPAMAGFMCSEGEKKHVVYDEHIESDVTVCLGCPVGEFYDLSVSSCQVCPLDTYQDVVGTLECKRCPPNTTTTHTGARHLDDCVPM